LKYNFLEEGITRKLKKRRGKEGQVRIACQIAISPFYPHPRLTICHRVDSSTGQLAEILYSLFTVDELILSTNCHRLTKC
jgi:hypothetical protein